MRKLYDWMMRMAANKNAPWALAGVSFIESSIFPIPPDVMLVPMILANRAKAWYYALIATLSSVAGGALGYLIGFAFFTMIAEPLLRFYGYCPDTVALSCRDSGEIAAFTGFFHDWGFWFVMFAGLTPFPFKVITIASGVAELNFAIFMLASVISRGIRFFAVSALLYFFGPPIRTFIEKNFGLASIAFFVLLIGGFLAAKYLLH